MNAVAFGLAALLGLFGLVHLLWATGSTWPCEDEATLAKTVVGARGIEQMPPRGASLLVALCLFAAGGWALLMRGYGPLDLPQLLLLAGGAALAFVFGVRGLYGIMPAFERMLPEQPFLRLNRRYYSPLCLLIALGFVLLILAMPNWAWRLGWVS